MCCAFLQGSTWPCRSVRINVAQTITSLPTGVYIHILLALYRQLLCKHTDKCHILVSDISSSANRKAKMNQVPKADEGPFSIIPC